MHKILEVYKDELQFYKLYVNDSKNEFCKRPFVSTVSDAKCQVNELITRISNLCLEKDEDGKYKRPIKNEIKIFKLIVNDFRSITHRYDQRYGNLNRYFLSLLISQIGKEARSEKSIGADVGLLLMYAEVAFYVFSLDMNVSASIKMCRILERLHKWAEKCIDKTILPELENKIYRETKRCLDIFEVNRRDNEINLEVLNLMLTLSRMMKSPFQRSQLVGLFNIDKGEAEEYVNLNYFQICTLLYIIGGDAQYEDIRKMIVAEINRRLLIDCALWHADNAMLFFDTIVCPYIDKKEVKDIIIKVFKCKESAYGLKYKELTKTKRWFFDWDKSHDLSELLSKKEYHSPYE